jgi:mxaD protein
MADGEVFQHIDRDPAAVWAVVGRFGGIDEWLPTVESCDVAGDIRTVHTLGMEFREKLLGRDDAAMEISYKIVESPLPLGHHRAQLSVRPNDPGAHVSWRFEVSPDDLASPFEDNYRAGLAALKSHLEN